ncbi:MAG: metallophosphoesterase [Candidatus Helarchaeota archaeon]|nr:metallophosphoesterase [Candidatus Helarchaeota archaeon]
MTVKTKIVKPLFSIFCFISTAIILLTLGIAISIFVHYFEAYELPLSLSLIGASTAILLTFILDKSNKFRKFFKWGKFNYRWIFIDLIALSLSFIILLIYMLSIDFNEFDLFISSDLNFFIYTACLLFFLIPGYLIYFGVKNLTLAKIRRRKFAIFAIISMIFLIVSSTGFYFFYRYFVNFPPATILNGNGYNDGPWLTWHNNYPNESICITWLTARSNSSIVYYGTNPGNLNQTATGSGNYLHKVYLDGLTPNTTYHYYIPENFVQDHPSNIFNFTTASTSQEAFKFAIVGDMQPWNELMMNKCGMVADGIIQGKFDFICQLGDIADDGNDLEDWHRVLKSLARMGANTPIQAVIGNHDFEMIVGSSNWGELFTYPYVNPNIGRYFSFDYHNAHFVMIDNFEHYYMMSDHQLDWIRNDIIEAKAKGQDWIFCFFHLTLMSVSTSDMFWNLQRKLVPIFDELAVDAVFAGHDHDYQHYNYTYGWNGLVFDKNHNWPHNAIPYFCSGGGGANLEVDYGIFDPDEMLTTNTVTWWNENINQNRDITYERRPWNSSKYLAHAGFPENYTHWAAQDIGKYYYHLPAEEAYHDAWQQLGFEYAEECYQYIQVEIDGNNCTISVRYPNGVLLQGPGDAYPQQWTFQK